jgi:predicted PurR-regulated permease PerM
VIFSLLAGGALMGFVGILVAIPVAATLGVLIRFFVGRYLKSQFYLGRS